MSRVLHVVSTLGTYGAEQFVMQLARRSAARGDEAAVMTIYSPDPAIAAEQATLGIPLFDMARGGRFELALLVRMVRAMREWQPAIVHAHTRYGKYWGRAAAVAAGVPAIVYTEHDNVFEDRRPYQIANAVLHPRTNRFVTFTPGHRERYAAAESIAPERIAVIENGIVPPAPEPESRGAIRARLGIAPDTFVVLRAARLDPSKNHALGIRAIAALDQASRRRMLLLIAGDGDERASLVALAEELGVSGHVRFLGFRRDVGTLMAASDACVFTSLWEGMPITMIEAMFAELPLITTPWVGSDEMLGGGAFGTIVESFEPSALAGAFAAASADREMAAGRARAAREHATAVHDISRTAEKHAELYASVLEAKARR